MSKITHNNIIMWLEDIVPQMQKSASAEDCLLKYAKEHNMPPAVLERMGHMFNSLKTNSAYNLAKTASDRGKYITTLDVPALVEKYSSFSKGTDFSKMITTISNLCPLEHGQSMILRKKTASSSSKLGDIKDLCILKDQSLINPELHEKVAKALDESNISKKASSKQDNVDETYKYINAADKIISLAHDCAFRAMQIKSAAAKKFTNKYLRNEFSGFAKSASDISRYLAEDGESDKDFCNAIEKLTIDICKINKKFASYIDEDSKKFASEKSKKFKLLKESDISLEDANLFKDYYDGVKLANFADQLLDIGSDVKKFAAAAPKIDWNNLNLKKPYTLDELDDLIRQSSAEILEERIKHPRVMSSIDAAKRATRKAVNAYWKEMHARIQHQRDLEQRLEHAKQMDELMRKREAREEQDRIDRKQRETQDRLEREINAAEAKALKEEEDRQAAQAKELAEQVKIRKELVDTATKGIKNIATGWKDTATSLVDSTRNIMNEAANAKYNDPASLDPIQGAMRNIQAKSILEQLLYTDPILSSLNDDEVDNLMEVYNTIVTRNPSVALDKGMLRSFLRQAANAKGIDVSSVKTLKEI